MKFGLRIFYRKIRIVNMDKIPTKGPVILASTHPNSFTDDVTLGAFLKRSVIFLARGDVFKSKIGNVFLKAMHVYPIYRGRENRGHVQKNLDNFSFYQTYLTNKGVILIHPEGISVHEKNVRPIKKGIGRIAFGAEEAANWNLGVNIVPIGINYTNGPYPQEDIMIQVSEPIPASKYQELYLENPNKANTALVQDLTEVLEANSIIQVKGTEATCEKCLILARNEIPISNAVLSASNAQFMAEKGVADTVNQLYKAKPTEFNKLEKNVTSYIGILAKNHITDCQVKNTRFSFSGSLLLSFQMAIAFLGYYLHILPYKLAIYLTEKVIQSIEFRASILLGLNYLFYLIIYTSLLITAWMLNSIWLLIIIIFAAFIGYYGKKWKRLSAFYTHQKNGLKLKKENPQIMRELQEKRNEICKTLNLL